MRDLDAHPVTIRTTDPETRKMISLAIGRWDVQNLMAQAVGRRETIALIPSIIFPATRGEYEPMARWIIAQRREPFSAMAYAMDCASSQSTERLALADREVKETLLGRIVDFPFPEVCDAWGVPRAPDEFRTPVHSDVPTLFISGTLDGRTPLSNAQEVMPGFSHKAEIVVEGIGHTWGLFLASPRIIELIGEFMRDRPVPKTTIPQPPIRFALPKMTG